MPFYKLVGTEIIESLSGESESKLRKLFAKVVESAPAILFIDEIDTIIGKKENANKDMEKRITSQMGACFDTINDVNMNYEAPIFIIGATNRPDNIDSSLRRPGRFDRELEIGMPNEKMREEMLLSMRKNIKMSHDISINSLVQMTPGFLPADLLALIKQAAYFAVDRIENHSISLSLPLQEELGNKIPLKKVNANELEEITEESKNEAELKENTQISIQTLNELTEEKQNLNRNNLNFENGLVKEIIMSDFTKVIIKNINIY